MWRQYLKFTCIKELFSETVPHSFSSKVCPANMQQIYSRRPIRKCGFKKSCVALLYECSTVHLLGICRTPFHKNTSRGLVLCFISFVLVQAIGNTFYWLAFIIYRPEFVDWSKSFLEVFFILWCIFRNTFTNACCNRSTYHIFISIISQTNATCKCRSSLPQVFLWKDHLIYTRYKCEEE